MRQLLDHVRRRDGRTAQPLADPPHERKHARVADRAIPPDEVGGLDRLEGIRRRHFLQPRRYELVLAKLRLHPHPLGIDTFCAPERSDDARIGKLGRDLRPIAFPSLEAVIPPNRDLMRAQDGCQPPHQGPPLGCISIADENVGHEIQACPNWQ
jgi:hypothetical protein